MAFLDPTNSFRWVLPTETDANSPITEELMSQTRENIETSILSTINTGLTAKVTDNGSGSGTLTIEKIDSTDPDWLADVVVGLTLVVTSGTAIGQPYTTITDNTLLQSGTATITDSTVDFQADGISVGDTLMICYNISRAGHTHNGLDSVPLSILNQAFDTYGTSSTTSGTSANSYYKLFESDSERAYFRYEAGMTRLMFSVLLTADTTYSYTGTLNLRITVPEQDYIDDDGNYATTTEVVSDVQSITINENTAVYMHDQQREFGADVTSAGLSAGNSYHCYIEVMHTSNITSITGTRYRGYSF